MAFLFPTCFLRIHGDTKDCPVPGGRGGLLLCIPGHLSQEPPQPVVPSRTMRVPKPSWDLLVGFLSPPSSPGWKSLLLGVLTPWGSHWPQPFESRKVLEMHKT